MDDYAAMVPLGDPHQLGSSRHSNCTHRGIVHSKSLRNNTGRSDAAPFAVREYAPSADRRGSTCRRELAKSDRSQRKIDHAIAAEIPDWNERRHGEIDTLKPGIQALASTPCRLPAGRTASAHR